MNDENKNVSLKIHLAQSEAHRMQIIISKMNKIVEQSNGLNGVPFADQVTFYNMLSNLYGRIAEYYETLCILENKFNRIEDIFGHIIETDFN